MKIFIYTLFSFFLGVLSTAHAYHGLVMVVKGDVQKVSEGASEAVKVGTRVSQGDTLISGPESTAKIVMSDRNVVYLSPDTKLTITKYEHDEKVEIKNVELTLDKGKIRCDVQEKYDGEKNKFLIKTPIIIAGVRGTDFITSYDATATTSEVITLKGEVLVELIKDGSPVGEQVLLKKNQMTKTLSKTELQKPTDLKNDELKKIDQETSIKSDPAQEKKELKKDKKENSSSTKKVE